jgi:hypothetical protein
MPKDALKSLAIPLAGALALAGAASAQQADPYKKTVYVACYAYTIGDSAAAYLPVVRATGGEVFNNLEGKVEQSVTRGHPPGYRAGCKTGDTPEAAQAARVKTGYVRTSDLPWPKDVQLASMAGAKAPAPPAGPRPRVWMSCGYDRMNSSGHAATPVFSTEDLGGWPGAWPWVKRLEAESDPLRRSGYSCDKRATQAEAEAHHQETLAYYANSGGTQTLPVPPEGRAGGGAAPAPKPAQTASLTVKTDTSIKDAARAWDEQVKKTLAAEAQKKVETAAKQAQADAKYKAEVEAFFAERRKQGRAQ